MKKLIVCTLVLSLLGAFGVNQNILITKASNNQTTVNQQRLNTTTKQAAPASAKYINKKLKLSLKYKNVNLSNCKSTREVVNTLRKNGYTNITMSNVKNIKGLKDILAAIQKNESCINKTTPAPTKAPAPIATPKPTKSPAPTATPKPTKSPAPTVTSKPTKTPAPTSTPQPIKAPAPTVTSKPTATPTKPASDTGVSSYAKEVLRLVNVERAKAGLSAYTTNTSITSAADKRAQEIKQSFSHTRPDGSSFYSVLKEYNVPYRTCGENIAYGQKTPEEVVKGWMNSPGHRANILNANFNKIGIGVYESNGKIYWTQEFTN